MTILFFKKLLNLAKNKNLMSTSLQFHCLRLGIQKMLQYFGYPIKIKWLSEPKNVDLYRIYGNTDDNNQGVGNEKFDFSKISIFGTVTVTEDGIAKDFTTGANYLTSKTYIDFSKPFEIHSKFILNNDFDIDKSHASSCLFKINGTNYEYSPIMRGLNATYNNGIEMYIRQDGNLKDLGILNISWEKNVEYEYVFGWDGNTYFSKLKEPDGTWKIKTYNSTQIMDIATANRQVTIGKLQSESSIVFWGEIDLNSFKIYSQGKLVYSPIKYQIPIKTTRLDKYDNNKINTVGTPTINSEGIISNFSFDNYLNISSVNTDKKFIIQGSFVNAQSTSTSTILSCFDGEKNYYKIFELKISDNHILINLSSNGISWDIANNVICSTVLENSTKYYWKFEYTGDNYKFYLSKDGINYFLEKDIAGIIKICPFKNCVLGISFVNATTKSFPFLGSMDLKDFFVFENNKEIQNFLEENTKIVEMDSQLCSCNSKADYITYPDNLLVKNVEVVNNQVVEMSTPVKKSINLPDLRVNNGVNRFTVDTVVKPKDMVIKCE